MPLKSIKRADMQSRQIQLFGFLGSAVLILFIVIFLGRDFHRVFLKYSGSLPFAAESDVQVIEKRSITATSVKHTAKKALVSVKDDSKRSIPVEHSGKDTAAKTHIPVKVTEQVVKSQEEQKSDAVKVSVVKQKKKDPVVTKAKAHDVLSSAPFDLFSINKEIHAMLGTVPFFHNGIALTSKNKAVLDRVAEKLQTLPFPYVIEVEGHTEAGIAAGVSETMALRVEAYLHQKIPALMIRTIGYADAYPIIDDPESKENRRVEIIIRRREG